MSETFNPESIRSVHLVPLTAYNSDGQIDVEKQAAHVSRMYSAGMRVFMTAAGTSEFHNLSADEIVELIQINREASGPDAKIFAPVGLQLSFAQEVAQRSLAAGATGIMFMPFAHPYMSDAGAKDYYEAVIDKAQCPTLIYKKAGIPSDGLLLEMSKNPHVVGIKYAENEMNQFRSVTLEDNFQIEWLCGSAERYAPYYMLAGATGFTTGAGNLCPNIVLAMHAAFSAGEFSEGMRLQQIILPIENYRARCGDSYNISMLKHGMKILGHDMGEARAPQRRLTATEEQEIETLLQPILAAEAEMQSEMSSVGLSAST
jgi:4-hydroxy-tetrahydrodipicolinate synthase